MNMTMYLYIGQSLKAAVKRSATIVWLISEAGLQKSRGNTILKVIQVTFISYIRNLPITALSSSLFFWRQLLNVLIHLPVSKGTTHMCYTHGLRILNWLFPILLTV